MARTREGVRRVAVANPAHLVADARSSTRILVDASVLLRFPLPSKNPARAVDVIVQAVLAATVELLLPPKLDVEIAEALATDPYSLTQVDPQRVRLLTFVLREIATPLPPFAARFPTRTRDPDDDYLLAYALREDANYLLTGDRDLPDLGEAFAPLRSSIRARSFASYAPAGSSTTEHR